MKFEENYKNFMNGLKAGGNHRYRAYDFCKELFDKYYQKVLNGELLTAEEKDYFALNLYCYLASWGMVCRGGLLLTRSYKFLIPLCDVLFDKTYCSLWNICSFEENYNCSQVMALYNALNNKIEQVKNDDRLEGKSATRLLLCKILMGTYGCVIAYDTCDLRGLDQCNVHTSNTSPLSEKLLQNTYHIIIEHKEEFKTIMEDMKTYPVNYTVFKVLDMILWIEGEKLEKNKKAQIK